MLACLAIAAFGAAILRTRVLPRWVGGLAVVWAIVWTVLYLARIGEAPLASEPYPRSLRSGAPRPSLLMPGRDECCPARCEQLDPDAAGQPSPQWHMTSAGVLTQGAMGSGSPPPTGSPASPTPTPPAGYPPSPLRTDNDDDCHHPSIMTPLTRSSNSSRPAASRGQPRRGLLSNNATRRRSDNVVLRVGRGAALLWLRRAGYEVSPTVGRLAVWTRLGLSRPA